MSKCPIPAKGSAHFGSLSWAAAIDAWYIRHGSGTNLIYCCINLVKYI